MLLKISKQYENVKEKNIFINETNIICVIQKIVNI